MRLVIDYDPDPDFSFYDEASRSEPCSLVALETTLYDGDERVGSLSNSTFYEDSDDWTTGTFYSVEDIPARCEHLRTVATDLIAEYCRSLPPLPPPPPFDYAAAAQRALLELARSVLAYDKSIAGKRADVDDYNALYRRVQSAAEHAGIDWYEGRVEGYVKS